MLKEEVDEEDIAALVSKWTGIPVGRLFEGEAKKACHHMEERLRPARRRPGRSLCSRRQRHPPQPRGPCPIPTVQSARSFSPAPPAWARPELARALAEFLFDDERAIIRLDKLSEYMEKHTRCHA